MSYGRLVIDKYGKPSEVLRYTEDKISDLPELGDDELILQNLASPIHPSILYLIQGQYENSGNFPITPGNDTVSRVYKKGSNVTKYDVGQRVIPSINEGAFSEYIVVKENQILSTIPDEIDDLIASQFFVNGMTAYQLVVSVISLKEGEWALQTCANSIVGKIAIQVAKAKGIPLISVVRKKEQVEELKSLGAPHVLVYEEGKEEELQNEVLSITGGKGVRYALEAVGGKIGTFAFNTLGYGGTLVIYGIMTGQPIEVLGVSPIFKSVSVNGFWILNWLRNEAPAKKEVAIKDLISLLKEKKVKIQHDFVFEFKEYKEALEASKKGKVVLVPRKN